MLKTCSKCGKLHQIGERCPESKRFYQTTQERKMRSSSAWRLKSEEIRGKAHYLCEVCRDQGKIEYNKIEVHHIKKLSQYPELLLDNYNLVSLCEPCHTKADAGEIPVEYLQSLAKKREEQS